VLQPRHRELLTVEVLRVGPELQPGAGAAASNLADNLEIADLVAAGEGHVVFPAVPPDPDLQMPRQGIHHRNANPVQATGKLVALVGELAPGVQPAEDHLDTRTLLARVLVHRHPAAVVGHRERPVLVQDHVDVPSEAADGLVHRVVDHLLGKVIGTGGVGVHARALAHRVQAFEDFDVGCGITHLRPSSVWGQAVV